MKNPLQDWKKASMTYALRWECVYGSRKSKEATGMSEEWGWQGKGAGSGESWWVRVRPVAFPLHELGSH